MATTLIVGALHNEMYADGVVITPGSEEVTLPASNLRVSSLSDPWQSTGLGSNLASINVDLGIAKLIGTLAVVEANFSATAQVHYLADETAIPASASRDFPTSTITQSNTTGNHLDVDEPLNPIGGIDANAIVADTINAFTQLGFPGDPTTYATGARRQIIRSVGTAPAGGDATYVFDLYDSAVFQSTLRTFVIPAGLTQYMFTAFDATGLSNPGPEIRVTMTCAVTGTRLEAIDITPTTTATEPDFDSGLLEVYPSTGAAGFQLGDLKLAQSGYGRTHAFNLPLAGDVGNSLVKVYRVKIYDGQNESVTASSVGFVRVALMPAGPLVALDGTFQDVGSSVALIGDRMRRILDLPQRFITAEQLTSIFIGIGGVRRPLAVWTYLPGVAIPTIHNLPFFGLLDGIGATREQTQVVAWASPVKVVEER